MHQPVRDLFGEVPITRADVDAWLLAVPRISPHSRRAAWYIRAYDVIGKITRAKIAGEFEQLTAARDAPAYWWHRFHWG